MQTSPDKQKTSATQFLRMVVSGETEDAYRLFIAEKFVHHNPFFKAGRESLMKAMIENSVENPDKIIDICHVIGDGDLVAVYSHVRQNPEDKGSAVMHIFRFQNGMIAELWDIGMVVPQIEINTDGLF